MEREAESSTGVGSVPGASESHGLNKKKNKKKEIIGSGNVVEDLCVTLCHELTVVYN